MTSLENKTDTDAEIADSTKGLMLGLYRQMQLIRRCEERLAKSYQLGLIHGACHTYVGEEAIATAVCAHLRNEDVVFSTHRGHGHALAKGLIPGELIAELYGRQTGCSQGRGGSMHLFKPEIGLMGTSGIVGPCILQACGGAYSFRLTGTDQVSVAFFGDGAVNNGAFHEGLNMAAIWKLPVLFVCENNQFATEVPFDYASGIPDVGRRAENYGLPGYEVDGNDVMEIHRIAGEAIRRARAGEGATLIECKTYRTRTHAEGMVDFNYRTRDEVDEWKGRCPIKRLRALLLAEQLTDEAELEAIDAEIKLIVEEAHKFAEESAFPQSETAATHVVSEPTPSGSQPSLDDNGRPNAEGDQATRAITYMQATHEALSEEMAKNDRIFVMGEGIGKRGGNFNTTSGLFDLYGALRLCDTPICERGFVGLSCGAAMTGTRPVVDFMFTDFILDAVGEIVNQIAKMRYMSSGRLNMPVLLRGCFGIGHSAGTHHSGNYYPLYARTPGIHVVVPATPYDAKGLMKRALNCSDPVMFLEHRELLSVKGLVPDEEYEIDFGRARVVQEGTDVTVVALALMVHKTLEASHQLAEQGISVELIDPRTVSPLDTATVLESVAKTGRLLIVDETIGPMALGAEIAACAADAGFNHLDAPVRRLNGAFTPTPYSPTLERAVVPHVDDIVRAVTQLMEE